MSEIKETPRPLTKDEIYRIVEDAIKKAKEIIAETEADHE